MTASGPTAELLNSLIRYHRAPLIFSGSEVNIKCLVAFTNHLTTLISLYFAGPSHFGCTRRFCAHARVFSLQLAGMARSVFDLKTSNFKTDCKDNISDV